ncbi:Uma2 family endonuclease [bacterium]|nr:Uma2 family endonuclease [bacterium]
MSAWRTSDEYIRDTNLFAERGTDFFAHVSWQHYETLLTLFQGRPRLRMTYLEGNLEIMTISLEHEMLKKIIARLLEIYALERDIDLFSCGSATFRSETAARGLEPDESYCLGSRKDFPDLSVEIVLSSGGIDKLNAYAGLGVQEVWFWQDHQFRVYHWNLSIGAYEQAECSTLFPRLDLTILATYIKPEAEPQAIRAFRQLLRQSEAT